MWEVPGKYLLNKMSKINFYLVGVALCNANLVQKISNAYSLEMIFFFLGVYEEMYFSDYFSILLCSLFYQVGGKKGI